MHTKKISRRSFVSGSLGAALAMPAIIPSSAFGQSKTPPSERITIGVIGSGGQGSFLIGQFLQKDVAQLVAVCDAHSKRMMKAKHRIEESYGEKFGSENYTGCDTHKDFREILDRDDIDAVIIATPDNWHAVMGIMAADAGKDIYGEKPFALTIREGRALVEAVKRNNRVFQTGSMRRSWERFRLGCEMVRNGLIGELKKIESSVPSGWGCEDQPETPIPDGFDYDMWLGPAPWAAHTEMRWNPRPSFLLDYGNGMITDLGTHFNDIAQWGHGTDRTGPISVDGRGEFPRTGLYDTMLHCHIEYEFADGIPMTCVDKHPKPKISVKFIGTEGWIDVGYNETTAEPQSIMTKLSPGKVRLYRSNDHYKNFLDCVKSREETAAPPEVGHRSFSLCCLGNISMRVGRKIRWNPDTEEIIGDPEASRMLFRSMRAPWRI